MKTLTAALAVAALALTGRAAAQDDHPPLPAALERFHDLLAPDWHAAPGAERNEATCSHAEQYLVRAREVAATEAPDGDDGQWGKATAALVDASAALGAYCSSGFDCNVSAGLTTLHDRFHGLMELLET